MCFSFQPVSLLAKFIVVGRVTCQKTRFSYSKNMFTDGTLSLTQCIYVLLVQSFYLLWIFKQGTGNNILDFCLSRIRKLISFRKHKITCIFKSWQGGLLPLTVDQDSEVKTGSRGCCLLINILWGDVCLNSLDLSAILQHHCSCKYVFESHLFKWIILSIFRSQN